MKREKVLVILLLIGCFLFLKSECIGKNLDLKASPLQSQIKGKESSKIYRTEVPLALKTKLGIFTNKFAVVEKTFGEIQSTRLIKENQANALGGDLSALALSLKEAFDQMVEEVKKGNPQALPYFESTVKNYERKIKAFLTQAEGIKEKLRTGEIKPERQWLQNLTPAQREAFFKELTPQGQRIMRDTYPELFRERSSFLRRFFSIKEAEARIVEPCEAPCGITAEQAMGMSEEQLGQFWEQASEECKNCVYQNNIIGQAISAWQSYQQCREKGLTLLARGPDGRIFVHPLSYVDGLTRALICLLKLIETLA